MSVNSDSENVFSIISRADQGNLIEDANRKMRQLIAAVMDFDAKGKLSIVIHAKKIKGKQAVEINTELKADIPEPPRPSEWYFADEEGHVSRKDPRQPELPETNVSQLRK